MIKLRINSFRRRDDGAMTVFGLFMFVTMVVIGGLALDVANAMMARTQLQVAADAVAHAALYTRETENAEQAKITALSLAEVNMPSSKYGTVLTANDINFGYWDDEEREFEIDNAVFDSVFVDVSRMQSTANPVGTYFLRFVGIDRWDVRRGSVFETYIPTCFREGFVAEDVVDIQSNNSYINGFCIHSNTHVEVNSNNFFENGTIVSMPDKRDIILPSSGLATNNGLGDSLRDGSYQIRILNRLADIIDSLEAGEDTYMPDYINYTTPVALASRNNLDETDLSPGFIYTFNGCSGNQKLSIKGGSTIQAIVLITNCKIQYGAGAALENSLIATRNTGASSQTGASSVRVGRDDSCATDGGSQLLTLGGMDFPSDLQVFGSQLIAMDDINFAANANGIEGASFIAGGTIDGTSNMTMGFCGNGMERNLSAEYFRLVN